MQIIYVRCAAALSAAVMMIKERLIRSFVIWEICMENLDFFVVNSAYATYLQNAESADRGFSRVPNLDYGDSASKNSYVELFLR